MRPLVVGSCEEVTHLPWLCVAEPCNDCCKGSELGRYSLGIKLKCTCQKESASYEWVMAAQVRVRGMRPAGACAMHWAPSTCADC